MNVCTVIEDHPLVDGLPTCVLRCGEVTPGTPTFLIIPGNPGISGYYEDFMISLYERCSRQYPVLCVSHLGHVTPTSSMPQYKESVDYYSVHGQVEHKLMYIQDHLPSNIPLILVGHSIGCYIILHLLDQLPQKQVVQCCLLFPTVERMASSPNGLRMSPWLCSPLFRSLVVLLCMPLYYLVPHSVRRSAARWHFGRTVAECAVGATAGLINPTSVGNSLYMAYTEMCDVSGPADHDIIDSYTDKLMFYYGANDQWCPTRYHDDMKARHPNAHIILCKRKFLHAFVLESSNEMASVLHKWLASKLPKLFKH